MEALQEEGDQLAQGKIEKDDAIVDAGGSSLEEDDHTDDEVDKRQYGIYRALPVDDVEPDWESGEAATVEEYLRRVRFEVKRLPAVVTSAVDPRTFDEDQTQGYSGYDTTEAALTNCPEGYKPSLHWIKHFLTAFVQLRQRLQQEYDEATGQIAGLPLRIALSHPPPSSSSRDSLNKPDSSSPSSLMPELEGLRGCDQVTIIQRLVSKVKAVTAAASFSPEDAAYLYALSARLERPLHADTAACYCRLLRKCKEWRAAVADPRDEILVHLNIAIALAGAFFRQDEELAAAWGEGEYDFAL